MPGVRCRVDPVRNMELPARAPVIWRLTSQTMGQPVGLLHRKEAIERIVSPTKQLARDIPRDNRTDVGEFQVNFNEGGENLQVDENSGAGGGT